MHCLRDYICRCISIHAPSRERPCLTCSLNIGHKISIHAPSRERLSTTGRRKIFMHISIHAPSRERHGSFLINGGAILFQSTLPRGSDFVPERLLFEHFEFQSTLPRGSDFWFFVPERLLFISIHAPSRERPQLAALKKE